MLGGERYFLRSPIHSFSFGKMIRIVNAIIEIITCKERFTLVTGLMSASPITTNKR